MSKRAAKKARPRRAHLRQIASPEDVALFERAKAGEWMTNAETDRIHRTIHPGFTFRYFAEGWTEYTTNACDAVEMLHRATMDEGPHWRLMGRSMPILAKGEQIVLICLREEKSSLFHWAVMLNGCTLDEGRKADVDWAMREAGEAFIWEHRQREYIHPIDAMAEAEAMVKKAAQGGKRR